MYLVTDQPSQQGWAVPEVDLNADHRSSPVRPVSLLWGLDLPSHGCAQTGGASAAPGAR
jgi:hypothetical protein